MPLNTSISGDFDFNGGWLNNGVSISGGDIYVQTGYFYNMSSLQVNNLEINGSLLPYTGFDNAFDIGSSSLRWRDLWISRDVNISGTLTGNDASFLGSVGIGTTNPSSLLTTGISSGKNEVNLSGVLYVNSTSGRVGIGTTSPRAKLQIGDSLGTWSDNRIVIGDASAPTYLVLGEDSNNRGYLAWSNTEDVLTFATKVGGTWYENTLVLDDGKVGIGTTNPDLGDTNAGYQLYDPNNSQILRMDSGGSDPSVLVISSTQTVDDAVNAVIAFQDPGNDNNHRTIAGIRALRVNYTASPGTSGGSLNFYTKQGGYGVSTTPRMTISSTGNVGIGTTTPGYKLDVNGNAKATQYVIPHGWGVASIKYIANSYTGSSCDTICSNNNGNCLLQLYLDVVGGTRVPCSEANSGRAYSCLCIIGGT